jgi:DNA-binding GntR family transcriptional regulator
MLRREATKGNQRGRSTMTRTKPRPRRRSPLATLNATSLYETCAAALNREIETGALRPGQRLPSERSLGDALGFTRLTVRRALQVLAERGLLEPDERRGWQVRSGQVSDSLSTLMGFTQMARMRGLVASSRILSLEYRGATFDESEALRVAPGAPMLALSRLRLLDDQPTAVERLRMPTNRLRWPDGFDFTGSIYAALESQGIVPTIADAYVDVVDATEAEASLLGVATGRGLLRMNCVTTDADGVAISLESSMYHPDRYRFRAILHKRTKRWP